MQTHQKFFISFLLFKIMTIQNHWFYPDTSKYRGTKDLPPLSVMYIHRKNKSVLMGK